MENSQVFKDFQNLWRLESKDVAVVTPKGAFIYSFPLESFLGWAVRSSIMLF